MPQLTNLNVSPYFDDFDPANDYYRVLFKPGYPVQARELTGLQSMLQNQIEKFGQHFFKEGAKVIPGNTSFTTNYTCIQLNNEFQGVPVAAYVDQLVGSTITGQTSGVTATVDKVLSSEDSENNNLTLYVNYRGSNTSNNQTETFSDAENLTSSVIISSGLLGNTTISIGAPFASTVAQNAAGKGAAFHVEEGVYFVRGQFVNVSQETLILDQYTNTPSYKIGFNILEEVITADLDETLNDNSQGFNNYSAPGADRLKVTLNLFKKDLTDIDDSAFVELAKVEDGVLRSKKQNTEYNTFADELARRTYEESGDYYVKPFDVSVVDSLNDNTGNSGIFQANQFTYTGGTPSKDLALYNISEGKAYVRGYEIETLSSTYLDVPKPRTTSTLTDQAIEYKTGPALKLNRVYGSPTIGIGNTYTVSLRDQRTNTTQPGSANLPGKEIGQARVYDIALETGSYSANNANLNEWDVSLYDIQTITELSINESPTEALSAGTFVKGNNSGATGFLRYAVSAGVALTVTETSGNFIKNEALIFNGITNGRVAVAVTEYGISNIKSLWGTNNGVVGINTFCADVIQTTKFNVGVATISPASGAGTISTIRSTNPLFPGTGELVRINDLVQYSDISSADRDPIMARVTGVGATTITVTEVTTVSGVVNGSLPTSALEVSDLKIVSTDFESSDEVTLYTELPKHDVSNVDLTDASISIRKAYDGETIALNRIANTLTAGENETFLPFDPERYAVLRSDGTTEELTADRLVFSNGMTQLDILNLSTATDSGNVSVITTLKKIKPVAKKKIKKRVNSIIVDKSKLEGSGIGSTSLNNGLTYGSYPYGTRVEDETISLNVPDIIQMHGIFETTTVDGTPSAPSMDLTSINSSSTTTTELIVGEYLTGQTSNAIACVAEKSDSDTIAYIYKNDNVFVEGETVIFAESNVQAVISELFESDLNISNEYFFTNGQKDTFYDYGTVNRKPDFDAPTKAIKIYFESAYYDSTDTGDITTVDSYKTFDYTDEIQEVNGLANTDMIDIRPRVADYTVSESASSPLTFAGRTFNQAGQTATNILASDESIVIDFSYYLGRIDRVFLTKDGKFQVVYGSPAEDPQTPGAIEEGIEVAQITFPPYLYNVNDATINFLEYKRFRMSDINNLESRIRNLEFYTNLSLLETNTANFFVPDSDGLNRFKSGFFVDNFETFSTQDSRFKIKNSINPKKNELRPRHYTNSVDLQFGPVVNTDDTADLQFNTITGTNIRRHKDLITLDYSEVSYILQPFGSRTCSVTPFIVAYWKGILELNPESDTWVNTVRLQPRIVNREGDFAETVARLSAEEGFDAQSGLGPQVWNSWQDVWTGQRRNTNRQLATRPHVHRTRTSGDWRIRETISQAQVEVEETVRSNRTGTQQRIIEDFSQRESQGDRVVSRDLIPFMRARNIELVGKQNKPTTRLYAFFDGVDVTKYVTPKLLQISMTTGTFQVGEKVTAVVPNSGNVLWHSGPGTRPSLSFRVAQSNHKEGPYNAPTKTFGANPYNEAQTVPVSYSATSTTVNIDTAAFASQMTGRGEYTGFVEPNMVLRGESSGAQATITEVRLISDISGFFGGTFFIPPQRTNFPSFTAGTKQFKLTSDAENAPTLEATSTSVDNFTSQGFLDTIQETIIATRNARVITQEINDTRETNRTVGTEWITTAVNSTQRWRWRNNGDPLAQSFSVEEPEGVFVTKLDVFFATKDDTNLPVILTIRTMSNGTPTETVVPLSESVLDPEDVTVSNDGSVATTFEFKAPVYLEGGMEYALVMLSNSAKYSVYISRVGDNDLIDNTYIANQPLLGSLFKSQNASTWDPSQWEDLKFNLYRADFVESGTLELYSPELSETNNQIPILQSNPLSITSRGLRVGLGTTVGDSGYVIGNEFYQLGTNATGTLAGVAGTATGALNIINAGIGYTPISGGYTFAGVVLDTITGNGRGATADISVSNGVAVGATISGVGTGYQVGDVLGITTVGLNSLGRNARFSVVSIGQTTELILENVQGNFVVGSANTMYYYTSAGISSELNSGQGGDVQVGSVNVINDGLHIKVNHQNHGMYFSKNNVKISGVEGDNKPTKLTAAYNSGDTGSISVQDSTLFSTFENVGVGTTNYGYLKIGEEIISYSSVTGNLIGVTTRGIDGSSKLSINYSVGTPVSKYELGGVNLLRINKTHGLSTTTAAYPNATSLDVSDAIQYDSYNIKLDMSQGGTTRNTDVGNPALYLNSTKSTGGSMIRATQNMPYEVITPMIQNVTLPTTSLTGQVVTVTSKSIDGNEIPYIQTEVQDLTLNTTNYLDSPRLIASKINEDTFLTNIEGNKSLNMTLFLNSTKSNVSPVIDGQRKNIILTSNRVNKAIKNYATDSRVNDATNDPTACQYISKEMILENNSTSLKVLLSAHLDVDADIRVLYAINNKEGMDPIFTPFPGYKNLNYKGEVISQADNDGLSDKLITKSNSSGFDNESLEFKEYTFSVDDLPSFKSYRIKILLTSTNQVYVPRIKDLRVMALA
jgi:hypothetical protein